MFFMAAMVFLLRNALQAGQLRLMHSSDHSLRRMTMKNMKSGGFSRLTQ